MQRHDNARGQAVLFLAVCAVVGAGLLLGLGAILYSRLKVEELPPELASEASTASRPAQVVSPLERPAPPDEGYVGSLKCAECHGDIAQQYATHPMSRSMATILDAEPLEDYEHVEFSPKPPRTYKVEKNADGVLHHEMMLDKNGQPIYDQAVEVKYVLGSGQRGRSYLMFEDGMFFQSPIGWYRAGNKWDLSPGYQAENHRRFSRRITDSCLYCHAGRTTPEPTKPKHYLEQPFQEMSIGCERCHGPGQKHVAFHEAETAEGADPIVNPADLTHAAAETVCYQCHLQGDQGVLRYGRKHRDFRPGQLMEDIWVIFVASELTNEQGQARAVTQVEQMRSSMCYRASQGKMGCTSCHDPHSSPPAAERVAFYQDRCNRCHSDRGCSLPEVERLAEPAAGSCIACHMPSALADNVPHTAQSDHRILRVSGDSGPAASPSAGEMAQVFDGADQRLPKREVDRAKGLAIMQNPNIYSDPQLLATAQQLIAPLTMEAAAASNVAFLDVVGDDVDALNSLGLGFQIQRDYDRANACWQQILKIAPNDETALWWLLVNSHERGSLDQAVPYLDRLLALNPLDPNLYGRKAHMLGQAGDLLRAIQSAEVALRLDPTLLQVREWLVEAYDVTEQPQKRREQMDLIRRIREVQPEEE
jgi:hypothetical protein